MITMMEVTIVGESIFINNNNKIDRIDLRKEHITEIRVAIAKKAVNHFISTIQVQFPMQYTRIFANQIDVNIKPNGDLSKTAIITLFV